MAERKNSKLQIDNLNGLTSESKKETQKATKTSKATKPQTEKKIKDQSAYLKLDLQPSDAPDLKGYVAEQAGILSKKEGKYISQSGYIQRVLIADRDKKNEKKGKYDDIIEMLDKLDKADYKAIETLIKSLSCKGVTYTIKST